MKFKIYSLSSSKRLRVKKKYKRNQMYFRMRWNNYNSRRDFVEASQTRTKIHIVNSYIVNLLLIKE